MPVSRQPELDDARNARALPRLTRRDRLSYPVTLLLVLLREALQQFDSGEPQSDRLVLAIEELRDAPWLATCSLAYWGDLDAHGFGILARLRAFQPNVRSIMMDAATLAAFAEFAVAGQPHPAATLPGLDDAEQRLFATLRAESTARTGAH